MDEWRIQQQQQQQQRMLSGGVGPVLNYHPIRSRSSPYPIPQPMSELKQSYQYQSNTSTTSANPLSPSMATATTPNPNQSTTPLSVKNDSNDTSSSSNDENSTTTTAPEVYTPNNTNGSFKPGPMEPRMMSTKSSIGPMVGYHAGQQQMMAARARAMPYPMPPPGHHHHQHHPSHHSQPMYPHPSGPVCQCSQHMHPSNGHYPMHPSQQSMYYHQQHQQHEAWFRYQQQQAAWRQHQMQNHLQTHPQPVPIEQSYNAILSDPSSTTKLKATKLKTKKKSSNTALGNEESLLKYQPIPPSTMNLPVQQQTQSRACIPSTPATYYPAVYSTSNPYVPAQQLPPPPPSSSTSMPSDHYMYTQTSPSTLSHHQSQIFTSPLSNPGTPHQILANGEFTNGTAEFGVPYHHGAPGSVNSLTDALCPSGDVTDRQMTPGPPSVGTPRVAPHQYSFPQTPSTPQTINNQNTNPHTPVMMPPTPNPLSAPPTPLTRPRSSSEQIPNYSQPYEQNKAMNNVDDLAAYLKDPTNIFLTDDVSSTLFDDIDALANTYLGPQSNHHHHHHHSQTTVDHNSADDILLNFLCSDLPN